MWETSDSNGIELAQPGDVSLAHEPHVNVGIAQFPMDAGPIGLMVQAAQSIQRKPKELIERAKQIGGLLGTEGFYRFPMGGENIEGPSIAMAQALAQEWGGIVYQVRIVHTESLASGGQRVHLRASVADVKSLVCAEVDQVVSTAPPTGKFANKADQKERWHSMQIQSASSKIVRNAILRVLPAWYVERAFEAAKTVDGNQALDGKTLPEARKAASDAFSSAFTVTQSELEVYLGQPLDMWAVPQISQLKQLYRSLKSGSQSVEAWRASLTAKSETTAAPKKSALGISADSSSKPIDTGAARAAEAVARGANPETGEVPANAKA